MLSLNFTPFPTIETERLLLRSLSMDDADTMHSLRNNPQVLEYLNRDPDASIEETRKKMEVIIKNQEENIAIFWAIAYKETPSAMIGNICYWQIQKQNYRAEVGYMLHPAHWQKGIMKEALKAVLQYGFTEMKLHSIEAGINADNTASASLLKSCGFVKEAFFRENYYYNGIFYNSEIYSILNK